MYAVHDNISIYKIPLQIQYLFPLSSFRPRGSIGIDLYSTKSSGLTDYGYALDLGLGFICRLKSNLYISANLNSTYMTIIDSIISQHDELLTYLSVGLYFEL